MLSFLKDKLPEYLTLQKVRLTEIFTQVELATSKNKEMLVVVLDQF